MTNLQGNAIKYTEKGFVTVDVAWSMVGDLLKLDWSVTDTGIGIAADKLEHIFDKFAQADNTITRRFGGTGLGLSITRQLVEKMGGMIGVESKPGEGSRFWFTITFETAAVRPVLDRKSSRYSPVTRLPEAQRKRVEDISVLVADDHLLNQAFIKRLLTRMGITRIEIVNDGNAALGAYEDGNFDLILMDCHMPVMSGYDATGAIRELEKDTFDSIPIVAMTADAMAGTRERCIAAGMDSYISKPIDPDELKVIMGQWLTFPDEGQEAQPAAEKKKDAPAACSLDALREFADNEQDMKRFVEMFYKQSDDILVILHENCISGENDTWSEAAHKLKGGAAMIKAKKLHDLCAKGQEMRDATSAERSAVYAEIQAAYAEVRETLERQLAGRK